MYMIEWRKDKRFMGTEQIGFDTRSAAQEYLRRQYPDPAHNLGVPTIYSITSYTLEEVKELFPQM